MINFFIEVLKLENIIVLEYQENFADNLSSLAYGKILENNTNTHCYYENEKKKRKAFEHFMSSFNIDYNFISTSKIKKLTESAFLKNKLYINDNKIKKIINNKNPKNRIINLAHFRISDIDLISENIKNMIKFAKYDFLINYDILENIQNNQSIGLYISEKDVDKLDNNYIFEATKRLNKYIKQPKLYIFSRKKIENINSYIKYEIIDLSDWREEFYFLTNCKHKIILNKKNSYSEVFWAAIINQKDYAINIFDKKLKPNKKYKNWIGI